MFLNQRSIKTILTFIVCSLLLFLVGCSKASPKEDIVVDPEPESLKMYFPPLAGNEWETISIEKLGWNMAAEQPLYTFLDQTNTDAFIILQNGRIVLEHYFGDFNATKPHSWNSAAKTLTSFTAGIAQAEGFLDIDKPSSDYMGIGWSSLTSEQEQKVLVKHHLTMTTGLDYEVPNNGCIDKECLTYKNEAGSFWFYHNATYTLLDTIISGAVKQDFKNYFYLKVRDRIGMQGSWINTGYLNLYFSNARSMARFGLLNLNQGVWDGTQIINDKSYLTEAQNTSQEHNKSYGYLYWLNGKESYRIPELEEQFEGELIPSAPEDLYAGLGAFDQKLYIVPSKELVIVRIGDSGDSDELGPTTYDNELWKKINDLID